MKKGVLLAVAGVVTFFAGVYCGMQVDPSIGGCALCSHRKSKCNEEKNDDFDDDDIEDFGDEDLDDNYESDIPVETEE